MLFTKIKVLRSHGIQYIKQLDAVVLPEIFRGKPVVTDCTDAEHVDKLIKMCPTQAIGTNPLSVDLGKCIFCGECARVSTHIRFTNDQYISTNIRKNLIVTPETPERLVFDHESVRSEIVKLFGRALKLREISAGGDVSCEMELNASLNVNFDFGRYGIDFVASPRHADGIVITGPITDNMSRALDICYDAVPSPKIIILAGVDAISGGLFADSPALDRSFLDKYTPDLYVPGNPVHPLTFIDGVLNMLRLKTR